MSRILQDLAVHNIKWERRRALGKCSSCGAPGCTTDHPCPYQMEMNYNNRDYCNCCTSCTYECAQP